MRRIVLIAAGAAAALALVALLALVVLAATAPGHSALRRYGLARLNDAIDGTARVGRVGGALWKGVAVGDLELKDTAGTAVIRVGSIRVGYGLRDLLRRRLVFRNIEIVRPTVVLEQRPDGTWNVQELFRLTDTAAAPPRARMLVDLRGVTITDGTVIVRRRPAPDSVVTQRLLGVNVELRRLRLSHPDSGAIEAVVAALAARLDEPALTVRDLAGTVWLDGDSARLALEELGVGAQTRLALRGAVRWDGAHPAGAFDVRARDARFADLRGLVPRLPAAGGGRLDGRVTLLPTGGVAIEAREIALDDGRSRVRGAVRVAVGPRGGVTVGLADLALQPLDLRSLEPFADTLPVRGAATGRVQARGTGNDLAVMVDVAFRDAAAPGAPSHVTAAGRVRLGGPDGLVARDVTVRRATVALASLHRFTGAAPARGSVVVTGMLNGPWRRLRLDGATLTLADGTAPATVLRGTALAQFSSAPRLDLQFAIDTVSFAQLERFVPGMPLRGRAAGHLGVSGPLDSLDFNLSLRGEWGAAQARGSLRRGAAELRVDAAGTIDSLDLARHLAEAPPTRLGGRWALDVRAPLRDSAAPTLVAASLTLDTIRVAGTPFSGGGGRIALEPERYAVDSLWLEREDFRALVTGAIGRRGAGPRQLTFTLRADTLERLASLARWLRGRAAADTAGRGAGAQDTIAVPAGSVRAYGRAVGTVDGVDVDVTVETPLLRLDSAGVTDLNLVVTAAPLTPRPRFEALLRADSAWSGGLGYGRIRAAAAGTADTFAARAAVRFGDGYEARAAVRVARDSVRLVAHVDTVDLALPAGRWQLARPFVLDVGPDSIAVDTFDLRAVAGGGRVTAAGSLPRRLPGDFSLRADSVLLPGVYAVAGRDTAGIGGRVGLNLRITGSAAAPTMNIVAVLVDGRFADYRVPLLQLVGRYEERRLTFKGGLWRDTLRVLGIGASLPVDLALGGVSRRRLPGDWSVTAVADSVDLSLLNQITDVVQDPSGRLVAAVAVRGAWGEPARISGTVAIAGGAATIPVIGARYTGIDARLALADTVITVERARLTSGGTLDVDGRVILRRGRDALPLLQLRLDARRFTAMNMREFAGVTATGELQLRGPTLGATVTGRATIDAGYLMFADLVEKRIVNLDDPEFRAIVDSSLALSRELAPSAFTVFLDSLRIADLQVAMGADVWLRSTEANIQLAGDFRVSKAVEDGLPRYRMDGTLTAGRGTYRLDLAGVVAKDFRVTRGTVRFFGAPDFNPELDIAAEHVLRTLDGENLTVRAIITGTLVAPQLRLETDRAPPLSETEIVSYLMFGRPTFQLEGGVGGRDEVALVATAVASVASAAASTLQQSLVSELGLPLDYLTVRPGSATLDPSLVTSARIEAGWQLSGRTFLTLNAGLCEVQRGGQLTRLVGGTLEYRLSRRWTFEASYEPIVSDCRSERSRSFGSGYQAGVDLFWQSGIR